MKLLHKDKHKALPYEWYVIPTLILTLMGIANSLYLTLTHYRNYSDLTWSSFCAISNAVNCDSVAQSPWSVFWGIPVAIWGLAGYALFGLLLTSAMRKTERTASIWALLLMLGGILSVIAVLLGYISATRIGSYCILCLLSYLISFLLFFYSWISWRRFSSNTFYSDVVASLERLHTSYFFVSGALLLSGAMILLKLFMPHYWLYDTSTQFNNYASGFTEEGHPWIGAEKAELVVQEFTDYQCFQCYKVHYALRRIIAQYPEKIRLVHRHFPLDHEINPLVRQQPFHIGSGRLALLTIAAGKQNKFWEAHDTIFRELRTKETVFDLGEIADVIEVDPQQLNRDFISPHTLQLLNNDIHAGLMLNLEVTPSFVVDGNVYQGTLPKDTLIKILKDQ